ncbi:MAG: T9SS type A sorting domain-containing protein [Candidatus Kapabacteria bacterium]|nr:T9SS type A sorting domain-containing protein [Candidatus Kapabacteria bacterium]
MRHSDGSIWAGSFGGSVHRTTDNGVTWTSSSTGLMNPYVFNFYNDAPSGKLFAVTGNGFYSSSDGGTVWKKVSQEFRDQYVLGFARLHRGDLLVSTRYNIYASTDNGDTWTLRSDSNQVNEIRDIVAGEKDTLFASTVIGQIYRSSDYGKRWETIPKIAAVGGVPHTFCEYDRRTKEMYCYAQYNIHTSKDGCRTWKVGIEREIDDITAYCRDSTGTRFAAQLQLYGKNSNLGDTVWKVGERYIIPYDENPLTWDLCANYMGDVYHTKFRGVRIFNYATMETAIDTNGVGNNYLVSMCVDTSGFLYVGSLGNGIYKTKRSTTELSVPVLSQPPNKSVKQLSERVDVAWSAEPRFTGFDMQLSTTSDFTANVRLDTGIRTSQRRINALQPNTTYYWRSRTRYGKLASPWSETWSFTTAPQVPAKLKLSAPPDNSQSQPVATNLVWQGDVNAEKYHVVVKKTADQTVVVDDSSVTALSRSITAEPKTSYLWQVRAIGALGAGVWSDTWRFTTEETTSVVETEAGRIIITPNPATDFITVSLPADAEATSITLTDLRGIEQNSGATTRINTSGLSAGVYVVSITLRGATAPVKCLVSVVR